MKRENASPLGLYTLGIATLFLAGFFLLVVFGAQSYRKTVAGQNGNMHQRAVLSYLATTVKAYDGAEAVTVREDPDFGQVLVLQDGESGYAVRIYAHGGMLLEDYAPAAEALRPDEAQEIDRTALFQAELHGGVLRLLTDEGSVLLSLRSEERAG